MDKLLTYKAILHEFLQARKSYPNKAYPHYKDLLVEDEAQEQFIHIFTGWEGQDYFYDVLIHLALEDGKVKIYENNTDVPVEQILVESGIAVEDIEVMKYQMLLEV